ncbi:tight junction protein ZO-3 isoform X2 [Hyperolius riggenbachi]|uniref:tight junction protein ZO-3 isoform X2 n=1 Tax=Hyperolius riggenbachi TaxID=752182 RepID=UPI0035A2F5EE
MVLTWAGSYQLDPRKGFGIAISGGRDRPRNKEGENSVIISDIVPGGPADGRLRSSDRIVMVNGVSMENGTSSSVIQMLKSCTKTANVTVKRPRKIQIPVNNTVSSVSTGPPHSLSLHPPSEQFYSDSPEDDEVTDSVSWQMRHKSSSRETQEDIVRGYEGDSSSGRSSGGSNRHSSHFREPRIRNAKSATGNNLIKRTGKARSSSASESDGSLQRMETGSGMYYSQNNVEDYSKMGSESDIVQNPHGGLELVSGFKRLPIKDEPSKPVKTVLVKQGENQEYGLKLGSQIFIKHITESGLAAQKQSLQEGDLILKINGVTSENMSLVDTRRLIEKSHGKLTLTVLRDSRQFLVNIPQVNDSDSEDRSSIQDDVSEISSDQSPPSYPPPPPAGLSHQSSSESQEVVLPEINGTNIFQTENAQPEKNYNQLSQKMATEYQAEPEQGSNVKDDPIVGYSPDARLVQFKKERSIGLRLAGGNDVGIFVAAVQEESPAAREGMKEGDQILQVNDTSFHNLTREDAVLYLLNLPQNEDILLLTQGKEDIYRKMIKSNVGDSFYIRTHFEYEADGRTGLNFTRGEIFHVLDTMHRGKFGSWLAVRVGQDLKEMDKGVIPNRARAEQYASLENVLKPPPSSGARAEFWKFRGLRGAKKILKKSREDLSAITNKAKYPPYERVVLREASFKRPVVILGPISDIAHIKLCAELPEEFEAAESVSREEGTSKVIKLQGVREIAERNKHALLDITPTAVEHLNYVQFYPIVVFCNPENKQGVKAMRQWLLPGSKKSSQRLYSQAVKLRKNYSHLFTATIQLSGASDSWFRGLKEIIRTEQGRPIWTTEDKAESPVTEPLELMNESTVKSTDYLSCDSRANSDYEETDGEGGAYTDNELEEEFQEPALARSSEPVVDYLPTHHFTTVNSLSDTSYRSHQSFDVSYSGVQSPDEQCSHTSQSPLKVGYSLLQETEMKPQNNHLGHVIATSREYEHDILRKKFNSARSTSSEEEDYGWDGPATDL